MSHLPDTREDDFPPKRTVIEFGCPYPIEERYAMACSGEYGVFEMFAENGEINGYRGFRKEFGVTGIYASYGEALEAAFTEFGHLTKEEI